MDQWGDHIKINFDYFQIKKVNVTNRTERVNCFNRLRFLAEVNTKLQKMHFLDNLRIITQEGCIKTRQMTPLFSPTFSNLFVIFISEFENAQNSFACGPLLVDSGP